MAKDLVTDLAIFPFRYTYNRIMSPNLDYLDPSLVNGEDLSLQNIEKIQALTK